MLLSLEQIQQFSPDDASFRAASGISSSQFIQLGKNGALLWGLCQGSGKNPYRCLCLLDSSLKWKCSCPSRKQPCKHVLALLIHSSQSEEMQIPEFVQEFLNKTQEKKATKSSVNSDEAREILSLKRKERILEAVRDVLNWLEEQKRRGFIHEDPVVSHLKTGLHNAGLPRLAQEIESLGFKMGARAKLKRLQKVLPLLLAWTRIDDLSEPHQYKIYALSGLSLPRTLTQKGAAVKGEFLCLGFSGFEDGGLQGRNTWFYALVSNVFAYVQDFAAGGMTLPPPILPGQLVEAQIDFFPFPVCSRGVFHEEPKLLQGTFNPPAFGIQHLWERFGQELAASPLEEGVFGFVKVEEIRVLGDEIQIVDASGWAVPLKHPGFSLLQSLRALSLGKALILCGLFDGEIFEFLSACDGGRWCHLSL